MRRLTTALGLLLIGAVLRERRKWRPSGCPLHVIGKDGEVIHTNTFDQRPCQH